MARGGQLRLACCILGGADLSDLSSSRRHSPTPLPSERHSHSPAAYSARKATCRVSHTTAAANRA